jgi:hypothetical protein
MFTVFVELPSSRRKRATSDTVLAYGYEISLSNDRQSFGESVNIIIYDDDKNRLKRHHCCMDFKVLVSINHGIL